MFAEISHNRLKKCQNVVRKKKKTGDFQRICPTFQKLFLKSDFFDSFNGLRFLRVAMRGLCPEQKKTRGQPAPLSCAGSAARPGKNA
jgi:hypothetical protein